MLRYHWIDNFFGSLRELLAASFSPFILRFSSDVVFLSNEDKTRWFACIVVTDEVHSFLFALVNKIDLCLKEFNLPVYYAEPSFHVSILWKLSEFTLDEKSETTRVVSLMGQHEDLSFSINKISCKSGNKLMEIAL